MSTHRRSPREGAIFSLLRALARLVSACAWLVEALAGRLAARGQAAPTRGVQAAPVLGVRASPTLAPPSSPPPDDLLLASLRNLGFRDAEAREMAGRATGETLADRVRSALASRRAG